MGASGLEGTAFRPHPTRQPLPDQGQTLWVAVAGLGGKADNGVVGTNDVPFPTPCRQHSPDRRAPLVDAARLTAELPGHGAACYPHQSAVYW